MDQVFVTAALKGDAVYSSATVRIDPPLSLSRDASKAIHIGVALPYIEEGRGVKFIPHGNQPAEVTTDPDKVAYRVEVPSGPGPCVDAGGAVLPGGVWAAGPIDGLQYFYACVLSESGMIWARAPMQAAW